MKVDATGGTSAKGTSPNGPPVQKYSSHGNPIKPVSGYFDTFEVGACDLESVESSKVTREMLNAAQKPFMIKGLTKNWKAHERWGFESIIANYGNEYFWLHAEGNATLGKLLEWNGKYHMGHAVYPAEGCYSDPWRPYSPMLLGAFADDYDLPSYLGPMMTFQMGVVRSPRWPPPSLGARPPTLRSRVHSRSGAPEPAASAPTRAARGPVAQGKGYGIGVPPENHDGSWFAMVKGRKRWVLMPPSAGSARSGGPGTDPPSTMQGRGDCTPHAKPLVRRHLPRHARPRAERDVESLARAAGGFALRPARRRRHLGARLLVARDVWPRGLQHRPRCTHGRRLLPGHRSRARRQLASLGGQWSHEDAVLCAQGKPQLPHRPHPGVRQW